MRRPLISLACIFISFGVCLFVIIYDGFIRPPEKMERNPHHEQTYRAPVNYGIALREAGEYDKALVNFSLVHHNAPHGSRTWMLATINLAMCCEILGFTEAADTYYAQAGKFCTLSNNMRTAGAWRNMRREIENANQSHKVDGGRAGSSPAEPLISSKDVS